MIIISFVIANAPITPSKKDASRISKYKNPVKLPALIRFSAFFTLIFKNEQIS